MGLEDRSAQHDKEVVDKYIDPQYSIAMTTRDYVVRPEAVLMPLYVILPPVADAKGRIYSILVRAASPTAPVIITDKDDSECWISDITMTAKCERAVMYSDGLAWHPLMGAGNWGSAYY